MSEALLEQLRLLPALASAHVLLTLLALALGIAISLPLAIASLRLTWLQGPVLAASGVVQTIPSLALLALMVPLLGQIGFLPAIIALVLYSTLPILRNTVTGISGVEPAMTEAARGLGMTWWQMLRRVQLPLAAPVIIAGIRTSAVWLVGIATLSTPVGQASLGNFVFAGLQTQNRTAILVGCLAAAALALILDGLIRMLERSAQTRAPRTAILAGLGLTAVASLGLAPVIHGAVSAWRFGEAPRAVVVGSKTFTEQYILAHAIQSRLLDAGLPVRAAPSMGSTILFHALANGSVDVAVDYTGTIYITLMQRTGSASADTVLQEVTTWLEQTHGIRTLGRLGFENAYALAMRRDLAESLGVRSIDDLAPHAPRLRIGGDFEFFARPEWSNLTATYGLNFGQIVAMDASLMYSAVAAGEVQVISAFSTDGRIIAYDLVVLDDPRQALPPYDAVLLVSPQAAARPGLIQALQPLVGAISDERMRIANKAVDLDGLSPAAAAGMLLP